MAEPAPARTVARPRRRLTFYSFGNWLLRNVLLRLLLRLEVRGLEHVPRDGPLLVAINHTSFLDPLLVGAFFPRDVVMMAKVESFRNPFYGWMVRLYGAFPVRRGEADTQAVKTALRNLHQGNAVLTAPEGTRSKDGRLQPARPGAAALAARAGAPVLPTAIWGPQGLWYNLARLRRTPVNLAVGPPMALGQQTKPDRATLERLTQEIMVAIARLMPHELRGPYAEAADGRSKQRGGAGR